MYFLWFKSCIFRVCKTYNEFGDHFAWGLCDCSQSYVYVQADAMYCAVSRGILTFYSNCPFRWAMLLVTNAQDIAGSAAIFWPRLRRLSHSNLDSVHINFTVRYVMSKEKNNYCRIVGVSMVKWLMNHWNGKRKNIEGKTKQKVTTPVVPFQNNQNT